MVQVYDNYQSVPDVRRGKVDNPLSQEQAALPGRQLQELGSNVSKIGGQIAEHQQKLAERANKVRLNDAFNQASAAAHALRFDKDKGYQRLKGGDAVKGIDGQPLGQWYSDKLDKEVAKIRSGLGNTILTEQFDLVSGDLTTKFRGDTLAYEAEQGQVYAGQVRDATILQSANDIAANPAGKAVPFYVGRARDAATDKARAAGLDGDALALSVSDQLGKMHSSVVDGLLDSKQIAGAKAYFEKHKTDFSTIDAQGVQEKLDKAYSAQEAVRAVDDVWIEKGPKGVNAPTNRAEMDAAIRAKYKDDPAGLKAARDELNQRVSDWEVQERETNGSNVNTVWKSLLGGQSFAQVESTRAWLALPGDTQAQIKNGWRAQQSSEVNNYEDTLPDSAWAYYNSLMTNPTVLRGTSQQVLEAQVPQLGRKLVQQLIAQRERVLASDAKPEVNVQLDNDAFNTIAEEYGLKPFSGNDNDQAKTARVRSRLEAAIANEESRRGKVMTREERETFSRKQMALQVAKPAMFGADVKTLYTLKPDEAAKFAATGRSKTLIQEFLRQKYIETGDAQFEQTQANVDRIYQQIIASGEFMVDE